MRDLWELTRIFLDIHLSRARAVSELHADVEQGEPT